mmetsp:Transcript_8209/g.21907  ORF Transcript_8209/g.21907 Transcript_8209/m.21907 type:complete len:221 (-) Transcript_8209:1675-2337(-)
MKATPMLSRSSGSSGQNLYAWKYSDKASLYLPWKACACPCMIMAGTLSGHLLRAELMTKLQLRVPEGPRAATAREKRDHTLQLAGHLPSTALMCRTASWGKPIMSCRSTRMRVTTSLRARGNQRDCPPQSSIARLLSAAASCALPSATRALSSSVNVCSPSSSAKRARSAAARCMRKRLTALCKSDLPPDPSPCSPAAAAALVEPAADSLPPSVSPRPAK